MREVDIDRFAQAHAEGATVVDVREGTEYVAPHVPGARLIPMGHLSGQMATVPVVDRRGPGRRQDAERSAA